MLEGETYTTKSIILGIIAWLLDIVSSNDCRISVVVVAFVCGEIHLSQELLLMMLEFSDHFA